MNTSGSISKISEALCKFQTEVNKISKDSINELANSKYASLGKVIDTIRPTLAACNLAIIQSPSGRDGLTTTILHSSGEFISDTYTMKAEHDTPMENGARISYQRRYAILGALNLATDDTDGQPASAQVEKKEDKLKTLLKEVNTLEGLDAFYKAHAEFHGKEFNRFFKLRKGELIINKP